MANKESKQTATEGKVNVMDDILMRGHLVREESQKSMAVSMVREFVNQLLEEEMEVLPNVTTMIVTQIAKIDELISNQLNEVMHHPDFQKLEQSWRGLHHLVQNTE